MNWELDIIWAELHTDSTKEWKNRIREIDKKIALAKFRKNKSDYIKYIRKKWLFLFDVEKEQGLGKSYYDDTEEELD